MLRGDGVATVLAIAIDSTGELVVAIARSADVDAMTGVTIDVARRVGADEWTVESIPAELGEYGSARLVATGQETLLVVTPDGSGSLVYRRLERNGEYRKVHGLIPEAEEVVAINSSSTGQVLSWTRQTNGTMTKRSQDRPQTAWRKVGVARDDVIDVVPVANSPTGEFILIMPKTAELVA